METGGWNTELQTTVRARNESRRRGLSNLSRMGHCAPAVTQTILDLTRTDGDWLVRVAAGLPGGIGNTGFECGGVTAAVLLLGLRYGASVSERGLPVVVERGHAYCGRFSACHRSLLCREILGGRRLPVPCARVIQGAPELLASTVSPQAPGALPPGEAAAYARLAAYLGESGFHCAHAVFRGLEGSLAETLDLLSATYGFMGGTLFKGLTCSALAAGVMAIGLRTGEIETRRRKVVRMLVTMALGGDALQERLNRFNRTVSRANDLAGWFAAEFGSTQCRAITGCAFSSPDEVERFVQSRQVERCQEIAARVAERTAAMLDGGELH